MRATLESYRQNGAQAGAAMNRHTPQYETSVDLAIDLVLSALLACVVYVLYVQAIRKEREADHES